jgi:hypothetical protein
MGGAGEAAHVLADFGCNDLRAEFADSWNGDQQLDRGAKGPLLAITISLNVGGSARIIGGADDSMNSSLMMRGAP